MIGKQSKKNLPGLKKQRRLKKKKVLLLLIIFVLFVYRVEIYHRTIDTMKISDLIVVFNVSDKKKGEKSDSFAEKMATQVIKNLQIKVSNIHIRYEDRFTNPAKPFSIGITLKNLAFQV